MPAPAKPQSLTSEHEASVRKELDAILAGASFSGSKRCSDFLEFIVKHALSGDYEHLTERFVGADLFGRPVDYETATDSVVRVRATDVRRRLAQHYAEHRPVAGVVIELAPGSYIPDFNWGPWPVKGSGRAATAEASSADSAASIAPPLTAPDQTKIDGIRKGVLLGLGVAIVAAGLFVAASYWRTSATYSYDALDHFWQPVFSSKRVVTLCFGDTVSYWPSPGTRHAVEVNNETPARDDGGFTVTKDDQSSAGNIRAALSIMGVLDRHGVTSDLRWPQEVQETELDKTNVVYIGAFSNIWTMSLNRNLRFSFFRDDASTVSTWMIKDRDNPGRNWSITATYPQPVTHEYALITRIVDPDQKRVVISIGGLNQFGTQAAGEFLADEASLNSFAHIAPKGWERRNLQIVLEMEVSGKRAVNPRIAAIEVW